MIAKEIATLLDGMEYGEEIPKHDLQYAKENGAVIVFGASDDLMEFRGAITDELGGYGGNKAYLDKHGLIKNECDNEDCPYFIEKRTHAICIEAIWDSEGYSWIFKTAIPHETFEIFDNEKKYCRGIVFRLEDL